MNKYFVTTVVAVAISIIQATGQTTTTTTHTHNQNGYSYDYSYEYQYDGNPNVDVFFGIKAAVNLTDFRIRNSEIYQISMKPGGSAGIFMKLESNNFAFHYELWLRYKTFEMKNAETQLNTDYQYWSLELPLYFMGQINTGAGKVFIGGGPFVSLGLDGKQDPGNIDLFYKKTTTDKSIMQRWDFGLGVTAGFEFNNGITLFTGYQVGLVNNLNEEKDDVTFKSRTVSFGLGYRF